MPASTPFAVVFSLVVTSIALSTSLEVFVSVKQDAVQLPRTFNHTVIGPVIPTGPTDPFVNTTELARVCQTKCKGGRCSQNPESGITTCLTCGLSGFTVANVSGHCVDTSTCSTLPWCTSTEATEIIATHDALMSVARNLSVIPMPYNSGRTQPFMPRFGTTDIEVVDRFNLYLHAFKEMGAGLSSLSTSWDDEKGWWQHEYDMYRQSIPLIVFEYVSQVKTRMCQKRWIGQFGQCMAPFYYEPYRPVSDA